MIRFLLGVAVGLAAAHAIQQRQGRTLAGSEQTVGHVDELSAAAGGAVGAASEVNAGDGTGGRPDWDPVAQDGPGSIRRYPLGGTDSFSASKRLGDPDDMVGSETFNGA